MRVEKGAMAVVCAGVAAQWPTEPLAQAGAAKNMRDTVIHPSSQGFSRAQGSVVKQTRQTE